MTGVLCFFSESKYTYCITTRTSNDWKDKVGPVIKFPTWMQIGISNGGTVSFPRGNSVMNPLQTYFWYKRIYWYGM